VKSFKKMGDGQRSGAAQELRLDRNRIPCGWVCAPRKKRPNSGSFEKRFGRSGRGRGTLTKGKREWVYQKNKITLFCKGRNKL